MRAMGRRDLETFARKRNDLEIGYAGGLARFAMYLSMSPSNAEVSVEN